MTADALDKPERRVVGYWIVTAAARTGGYVALGAIAVMLGVVQASPDALPLTAAGFGGLFVLGVGYVAVTAGLRYRRFGFAVEADRLRIRHGVLVHHEKVIPISRMQHVDIDRGPLERAFGLASLIVYTAGGRGATFRVAGLTPERAEALRATVLVSADRASDDE